MKRKQLKTSVKIVLFISIVIIVITSVFLIIHFGVLKKGDNSKKTTTTTTTSTTTTTTTTTTSTTTTKKTSGSKTPKTPEEFAQELNINVSDPDFNRISRLNISAIGDSVMLGAESNLKTLFVNGSFDGKVSRQIWHAPDIIDDLKKNNKLGDPIIIALGTNSDAFNSYKEKILKQLEGKEIFWVTVNYSKAQSINAKLFAAETEYQNFHVIDWNTYSNGHSEYFYKDGIHLTATGRKAYTTCIYNYLYNYYKSNN